MRISDWSSDVCSADLDYTRFRDSGQLTGLVGYNPDFELSPGFMVGDAVAGTGIDPNDYLLNKKNFYSSYGYKDNGEADIDKPQRTEKRRLGKEWVRTSITRWWPVQLKKKKHKE